MSFRDLKIQVRYRSDENDIPKDFFNTGTGKKCDL